MVDVTKEDVEKIELKTRDQSPSKVWIAERSIRLTATNFHSCCMKALEPEGAKSLVQKILSPIPFNSKATDHGKTYEQAAIDKFNELHKNLLNIKVCGLVVPVERPYLGATPDRLLFALTVIEVKCPYVNRNREINEKTVPYLEKDENRVLKLKR